MTRNTSDYWRRRAGEERALADRAANAVIARIRNSLAECMEARAREIDELNAPRSPLSGALRAR